MGGEQVFVDFAGDMIDVIDPATGDVGRCAPQPRAIGCNSLIPQFAKPSDTLLQTL